MAFIGNILLVIALFVIYFLNTGALAKPAPGGDYGVGYAWSQIILNLAFVIIMILVTIIIGAKNGFEWVSASKSTRFWLVTIGMLTAVFTSVVTTIFRHEAGPAPFLMQTFSSFAPVAIPLVLILGGFILLNQGLRTSIPVAVYKWPLILVSLIGLVGTISATFSFMAASARNNAAAIKATQESYDENDRRIMAEIDSNDVMNNLVFLLVFTGDNQPDEIKNRAVAKVKTHPQWESELIRLIQTEWAPEPFQFLAFNDVENPSLFLEPVRTGITIQADLIRKSIRNTSHPSNFYQGQFSWEVERIIKTVDRFKGKGVDYVPAMKELRSAFDEPSEFEKPKWSCVKVLDKWIEKNS